MDGEELRTGDIVTAEDESGSDLSLVPVVVSQQVVNADRENERT